MRVAVPALGLLAIASACVTSGSGSSSVAAAAPAPAPRQVSPIQLVAQQVDSTLAQQVANSEGPGASIRAEFANVSGTRRVVASFHLNADAYVLVGHIDADGTVRIVFPLDPKDDGFVRGNRDYRTPEFLAGFSDEYRFRASQSFNYAARRSDSYDGQLGYAFIIASWRPMKFEQFQTNGAWDTFELADDKYLNDPRPAIYEMASLLAGQNREAYTVEFARYITTSALYAGGNGIGGPYSGYSTLGFGGVNYCGYSPIGLGYSGLGGLYTPVGFSSLTGSPYVFYSRGQYFIYDDFLDCYRSAYPSGGYGNPYYRIAGVPTPPVPVPQRGFTPRDRSSGGDGSAHALPVAHLGASDRDGGIIKAVPSYRERGLITPEDPGTLPGRRTPTTIDTRSGDENHGRPSLQDMVSRRPQTPTDQSGGWMRAPASGRMATDQSTYTPPARRAEPSGNQPTQTQIESRGRQTAPPEARAVAPVNRDANPRPAPETRSAPPVVREAAPRPAPEARSAPPPSSPPAQPPASSSSGAGTPIRPSGPPTA